jgi:hypothetical protein
LGTLNTRRQDRLLDGLKQREQQKPYSRGIHKGERRDPDDYLWPPEFNLWSALEAEAQGMRFVSPGIGMEVGMQLTNDGKPNGVNQPTIRGLPARNGIIHWNEPEAASPERVAELRRMAPPWGGRGPGMPLGNVIGSAAMQGRG